MGTPAGFRFSGRALIIIAVAAFVIAGLFLFIVPDTGTQVLVTEVDELEVSPNAEVLKYNNLSAAGQEVFDQGLRADRFTRVYQSPPDFDYPTGDTAATVRVEKKRDDIHYSHRLKMQALWLRGCTRLHSWARWDHPICARRVSLAEWGSRRTS